MYWKDENKEKEDGNVEVKMAFACLFFVFSFLQAIFCIIKIVGFSWIQTWIVGVEDKHADHLTTRALNMCVLFKKYYRITYFD